MGLALDQSARIVPRHDVTEPDVVRQAAEKGDPVAAEHGHARDDEALDKTRAQEPLDRDPTIDVEVAGAAGGEPRDDLSRRTAHLLDDTSSSRGQVEGPAAQHHHPLAAIGPGLEAQDGLEGLAPDDDRIDAGDELVVA